LAVEALPVLAAQAETSAIGALKQDYLSFLTSSMDTVELL
jgi:hypothetical protein